MNAKFAQTRAETKRQCLKRLIGITLGALLILPIISGRAFATHERFGEYRDWTKGPYYGTRGTFFADVTGDGKADAIVVNDNTVTVRRSDGLRFGSNEDWTRGSYDRLLGWNFFADVDGDRRADFIRNYDTITVRRSVKLADGRFGFGPQEDWSRGLYGGTLGTFFADIDGDDKADAIAVDYDTVTVRRSYVSLLDGRVYLDRKENWTQGPYYGPDWRPSLGTFFANVTYVDSRQPIKQGRAADAIVVNGDKIYVRASAGRPRNVVGERDSKGGFVDRTVSWTQEPYYGALGTFFADVTGDSMADAIVVNRDTVTVRRSMFLDSFGQEAQEKVCYGN